jgi:uncharacterized Zn finger protein
MTRYWDYYYEPARPIEVKNGIKAKSKRGAIGERWWSKRWVSVLESFDIGARLLRGRSYARKGQVISIDIQKGIVRSNVQGTRSKPYDITIKLCPLSDDDWEKAIDAIASKAVFASKLLSGEMPSDIEEAFADAKVALFPEDEGDLETECSCPDWSNPCKHIAAVYYILAEQFDLDPFLIFKLRGRTKKEVIEALRERRASGAADDAVMTAFGQACTSSDEERPLEECLDAYWQTGGKLDILELNPTCQDLKGAVLKRLGDAPFTIGKANMASLLLKAYGIASRAALQKAAGEGEDRILET